ncbi:mitochondrial metalloendopeptidase OMA1-like [Lolium rigidum]|uniref:mitochondrial metalloendopeptidase OMA1-like n=1 Tax=Lolium rigidum TaxID=89674 RepID=UPI001F5E1AE4|nr:mitochondrial metalloendopeptidase OMA1-like [Lolium rigidum]
MIPFTRRRGGPEWYQDKRVIKAAACLSGCAVITLCCGRFETVPYSNRRHFIVLPPLAEGFLGKCFFARSKIELASKILPPEHPDSVRVRKITMDIVRAAERGLAGHLDRLDWEVIVVKDKLVNASCLPGGKIIVYTGLLEQMEMDAEVATVLGHEVGHAIARHVAENITKFMWFVVLKIVFLQFIDLEEEDELIDGMWKVLFQLPFSRRMEMEADYIGIMLLAAAGFDPQIAPTVYEKMGKITGSDSELQNYISTHPSCKKRAQILSQDRVMQEAMELYRKARADKDFLLQG